MGSNEIETNAARVGLDALRERYRIERERRAPGEGERIYRDIEDGFAHLLADPYSATEPRQALNDTVDVLIVGGGFGGLLAGARLREAGVKKLRIVEAGGDVGGCWYWNRYPGAACDVESYIYLPLLEETGYIPKEKYSYAPEIKAHACRIGEKLDLYRHAPTECHRFDEQGNLDVGGDVFTGDIGALRTAISGLPSSVRFGDLTQIPAPPSVVDHSPARYCFRLWDCV